MNFLNQETNRGYITLLSVLIVGAVGVAITLSLLISGLNFSRSSLVYEQMYQAKDMANACAEEATERIWEFRENESTGSLSQNNATCNFQIVDNQNGTFTVCSLGKVGPVGQEIKSKIKVEIASRQDHLNISSWSEIADFSLPCTIN